LDGARGEQPQDLQDPRRTQEAAVVVESDSLEHDVQLLRTPSLE
jgi:hypothetical protein